MSGEGGEGEEEESERDGGERERGGERREKERVRTIDQVPHDTSRKRGHTLKKLTCPRWRLLTELVQREPGLEGEREAHILLHAAETTPQLESESR